MILKRFTDMLRGLFRANTRSAGGGAPAIAARLERKVLALVGNMPTLPDTATRAMALANDPDTPFADLARLIEGDAAIATGLLHVANSAYYSGGCPAVKLQQALVRLGMYQCKNLILSIGMKSLFRQMAGGVTAECEELWHHGYVTGSLCRLINRGYRLGFHGEEFSAGLLHDLGRILLALADREAFVAAGGTDFYEAPGVLERERVAIGIDHCALGAWFGAYNNLPGSLIEAMRGHHDADLADPERRLVALVAAADHMANHLQRGETAETYDLSGNAGLLALWARWPAARRDRLFGEIPALMEEAARSAAGEHAIC